VAARYNAIDGDIAEAAVAADAPSTTYSLSLKPSLSMNYDARE
jgi:hypothetical protein